MRAKELFDDTTNVMSWLERKIKAKAGLHGLTHILFRQRKIDPLSLMYESGIIGLGKLNLHWVLLQSYLKQVVLWFRECI